MSILKVEVGKPVTLAVKAVRQVDGNFGPQLAFDSEAGDTVFVGADTAQRQLDRLNMGRDGAVGETLLFEKVQKGNKTYLNINPAPSGAASKANGATNGGGAVQREGAAAGSSVPASSAKPLDALYMESMAAAKTALAAAGLKGVTAADVIAACATIFIQATKGSTPISSAAAKAAAPKRVAVPAGGYPDDDFAAPGPEPIDDEIPF